MLPISILQRTDHAILYELPPGKPNPKEKCIPGEDTRERVKQTGQKGADCWYYTFNYLRKRYGKETSKDFQEERKVEKLCSERRKELSAFDNAFPIPVTELYSKSAISTLCQMDLKTAEQFLQTPFAASCALSEQEGRENIVPYIQEFIEEKKHSNLKEFLIFKRLSKLIEVNMKFANQFGADVDELIKDKRWENWDIEKRAISLEAYVRNYHADLYHLNKSSWTPLQTIENLITELNTKGPLTVSGKFGQAAAYEDEATKMKNPISGRDIYYWPQGSKLSDFTAAHSVLLVGAEKAKDQALVYFIDPNDPSDPKDRSKQKIYAISYKNLTSNICSTIGTKDLDPTLDYAYHGIFNIPARV